MADIEEIKKQGVKTALAEAAHKEFNRIRNISNLSSSMYDGLSGHARIRTALEKIRSRVYEIEDIFNAMADE